jgi:hypothetical protein
MYFHLSISIYIYILDLTTGSPPKKTQNYWNNILLEFECPSIPWEPEGTKLNPKMRRILTGCIYYKYWLIKKLKYLLLLPFSALENLKQLLKQFLYASNLLMSSFYALVGSAECWGIQILTIRFWGGHPVCSFISIYLLI